MAGRGGRTRTAPLNGRPLTAPSPGLFRAHRDLLPVIAAGGALGSLARWGLTEAMPYSAGEFAWPILVANVTGAAALGVLMAFALGPWSHARRLRPFLGVGVLGGFTTFSTYALDTRGLLAAGRPGLALVYAGGSVLLALVGCWAGVATGRAVIAAGRARR